MSDPIRLAKRVAALRSCSRQEAEQVIAGGWVRVEGVVVEEPQFRVGDEQLVEIDPAANPGQAEPVTLVLHKPAGVEMIPDAGRLMAQCLVPGAQWSEDASDLHPLRMHFSHHTVCAHLETLASGLVVFSQDWRVVRKLTEDATTLEHEIVVEVTGELDEAGLKRLNQGMRFNGKTPLAVKVSWQNETRLRVALKGAQPGQVAHMCETVGLKVVSIRRIRLGSVPLGKLPIGQWRYLRAGERF